MSSGVQRISRPWRATRRANSRRRVSSSSSTPMRTPYPPSRRVGPAIQAAVERGLERYPDPTATAFRLQASEVLGVPPIGSCAANGSDDILTIVTRATVGPGDWLRLPHPSYILYRTLAQLQNARYQEISFSHDWRLPLPLPPPTRRRVWWCCPIPTARPAPYCRWLNWTKIAQRVPGTFLIDEGYVDLPLRIAWSWSSGILM